MFKLLFFPIRFAFGFVKFAGVRGVVLLALGVVVGLLVAPTSGARLRARIQARLSEVEAEAHLPADVDATL